MIRCPVVEGRAGAVGGRVEGRAGAVGGKGGGKGLWKGGKGIWMEGESCRKGRVVKGGKREGL